MKKYLLVLFVLSFRCLFSQESKNSVYQRSYDINRKLIGASKSYYDDLGKLEQVQSYDIKYKRTWASQTLYDSQGRPALQTLSAPITAKNRSMSFQHKKGFIRKRDNYSAFTSKDFEGKGTEPLAVGNNTHTLGWYYSSNNTDEPLQDITERPYSRTLYSKLNPGKVKQVVGGNKQNGKWRRGYKFSMPAAQEVYYVFGYNYFGNNSGSYENFLPPKGKKLREYTFSDVNPITCREVPAVYGDDAPDHIIGLPESIYLYPSYELKEGAIYLVRNRYNKDNLRYVRLTSDRTSDSTYEGERFISELVSTRTFSNCSSEEMLVFLHESRSNLKVFLDNSNQINFLKSTKTVVQDVHGNESVMFTDSDGKTLATARSGGSKKYEVLSLIGEQSFVDIHIPVGCQNTSSFLGGANNYKVYDLKTEKPFKTTPVTLPAGFYRIQYIGKTHLSKVHNLTYINKSKNNILPVQGNAVGVRYKVNYYDYSLNYYNDVGKLTASLQPLGFNNTCLNKLSANVVHNESLTSRFKYNALGQLTHTKSPDEGHAWFIYRKDGQIRFSINSKQWKNKELSYTSYDGFARPKESGVYNDKSLSYLHSFPGAKKITMNTSPFKGLLYQRVNGQSDLPSTRKEQHFTDYDYLTEPMRKRFNSLTAYGGSYGYPTFLSGNVARTYNREGNKTISETFYSYDIHGRVKWIVQYLDGLGTKTIHYEYDAVTSQVNRVLYQKGKSDEFIHRYSYDKDTQQLVKVETKTKNTNYITHANYNYYETGALRRTTLAGGIQDIDYVYNLSGQLKAINHPSLKKDTQLNPKGSDLFGLTLDYYKGDYLRKNDFTFSESSSNDQYNGNIKSMAWNTKGNAESFPVKYSYKYNKNNWLEEAVFSTASVSAPPGTPENLVFNKPVVKATDVIASKSVVLKPGFRFKATDGSYFSAKILGNLNSGKIFKDDYKVTIPKYDANGNIKKLFRNKNTENGRNEMDKLTYSYKGGKSNKLDRVVDAVTRPTNAEDIKTQPTNNYRYNEIGQLTRNENEKVNYEYNASGLVTLVKYNGKNKVRFYYNDKGFRTKKVSYASNGSTIQKTTDYVRDASGSVLAIYENKKQVELPIYGSSRLGIYNKVNGTSVYQLTDHLGNVRAVISKKGNRAVALSATDYYPFGMPMPNRIKGKNSYRYAYQGQEKDPETGKEAFQLRLWDGRIGRWLSPDPYNQFHSPYLGMGNNPTNGVDPDGGCWITNDDGTTSPCPDGNIGDTMVGNQGATWTYGEGGWDTNAFDANAVDLGTVYNLNNFSIGINRNFLKGTRFLNSTLSLGITSHLDKINFSQLSQVPNGYFSTTYNGNAVTWSNYFRGNGSVSGDFVKKAKLDFSKNLSTGKTLSNIKMGSSVLGYGLTGVTVYLDTQDYMNGVISGHRYSWKMGVTGTATGVGYFLGAGPGLVIGSGAMAAEKGYDVFVDPKGPVWSNYGSWIPTSAGGIMQGFGGW